MKWNWKTFGSKTQLRIMRDKAVIRICTFSILVILYLVFLTLTAEVHMRMPVSFLPVALKKGDINQRR